MVITRSKRRRLDEEEARRQQQPPPPTDFISRLPDDVLGAVITRLPSAAGARTQLLSRRWRPLWRYAPLNLEADTLAAAEAILAGHRGGSPCRRLCLTWRGSLETFPKAANEILRLAGLDGLQELELFYMPTKSYIRAYGSMDNRRNPAPLSMSRFSPTLRVLTVCCYGSTLEFPEVAAAAALGNFPHLEQLTLKAVIVPECTLHGILSGCPALQGLALHCNNGYRQLRISSRTLRSLGISGAQWGEVVIEDAPLLERIFQDGPVYHQTIRVIQAPKLKMLGYLRDRISRFVPPYFYFEERKLVSLRTVKILALHVASDIVHIVIDFLTCFPCVERFYMVLDHPILRNVRGKSTSVKPFVSLECLDEHLKILKLEGYRGIVSEATSLVRFFLSNARVLESLKFLVPRNKCYNKKWISIQRRNLCLPGCPRASPRARLCFMPDPGHHGPCVPIKHIHDLALQHDPFV